MAITTPVLTQGLTLEQFVSLHGDNDRLELIDGEVVDLEPTGSHDQVAALLSRKLNVAIDRLDLHYFITHRSLIKTFGI
ncbi:MAG: Uma2 family endonuclease, partial [Prochlorotrichaceae cyanobacterium]